MKRLAATALLTILAMFVVCRRSETPPAITQSEIDIASRPAEEWLRFYKKSFCFLLLPFSAQYRLMLSFH